jgi:hypothetical protein
LDSPFIQRTIVSGFFPVIEETLAIPSLLEATGINWSLVISISFGVGTELFPRYDCENVMQVMQVTANFAAGLY